MTVMRELPTPPGAAVLDVSRYIPGTIYHTAVGSNRKQTRCSIGRGTPMRVRDQHRATLGASARKTGAPRPLTAAAAASSYAARGQAARAASERIAATMRNVPFQLYQVDSSGTRQRRLKMPAEVQGPEATKQVCDDDDRAVFCCWTSRSKRSHALHAFSTNVCVCTRALC